MIYSSEQNCTLNPCIRKGKELCPPWPRTPPMRACYLPGCSWTSIRGYQLQGARQLKVCQQKPEDLWFNFGPLRRLQPLEGTRQQLGHGSIVVKSPWLNFPGWLIIVGKMCYLKGWRKFLGFRHSSNPRFTFTGDRKMLSVIEVSPSPRFAFSAAENRFTLSENSCYPKFAFSGDRKTIHVIRKFVLSEFVLSEFNLLK